MRDPATLAFGDRIPGKGVAVGGFDGCAPGLQVFEDLRAGKITTHPNGLRDVKGVGEKFITKWEEEILTWLKENQNKNSKSKPKQKPKVDGKKWSSESVSVLKLAKAIEEKLVKGGVDKLSKTALWLDSGDPNIDGLNQSAKLTIRKAFDGYFEKQKLSNPLSPLAEGPKFGKKAAKKKDAKKKATKKKSA